MTRPAAAALAADETDDLWPTMPQPEVRRARSRNYIAPASAPAPATAAAPPRGADGVSQYAWIPGESSEDVSLAAQASSQHAQQPAGKDQQQQQQQQPREVAASAPPRAQSV